VVDIDLKENTFKDIADILLEIFKGYYVVKTPSGGYHIYVKVKSEDKFKSNHLSTLKGNKTTIEILGEKKKVMGPGSIVDNVMYKRLNKEKWENTLSSEIIEKDDFISKLKEAGLKITSEYKQNKSVEALISIEKDRDKLIDEIFESRRKRLSIKFISFIHGSSQNKPNTILFSKGGYIVIDVILPSLIKNTYVMLGIT